MAHIFGIAHTFSGVAEQLGNVLGGFSSGGWQGAVTGFATGGTSITGGGADFATPADSGNGFNGNGAVAGGINVEHGNVCAPGTTEIREVVVDKLTGAVICIRKKRTRRRRKRLATQSDIADLASLKSILGGGKALDSWIATRGRR